MRQQIVLLMVISILTIALSPALAQENTVDAPIQIQITGSLTYQDVNGDGLEDVLVDGVVVLPTPGFYDLNFEAGQRVTVIGNLLPDNTIQATSLFIAPDVAEATPTAEPSPVAEEEPSPESTNDEDARDREEDEREREQERREAEQEREQEKREAEREREQEKREREQEREQEQREREREQDEAQRDERAVVEVSGEVTVVTQNYIVVDGVAVSSGGIFQPSQFRVGQSVKVTGMYENNGMLRALSIAIITAEEMQESTSESAATSSSIPATHPVVFALASEFAVEAADLIDLHCAGYGFGDITHALLIAEQAGGDPKTYLRQYAESRDWGAVARAAGLEPGAITPGRIVGS